MIEKRPVLASMLDECMHHFSEDLAVFRKISIPVRIRMQTEKAIYQPVDQLLAHRLAFIRTDRSPLLIALHRNQLYARTFSQSLDENVRQCPAHSIQ
jgi:hypothetical protein